MDGLIDELWSSDRSLTIGGSFRALTEVVTAGKFPSLRADDVDILNPAGSLDPLPFVPCDTRAILSSPGLLFPPGVRPTPASRACKEPHIGDRATLTIRMLRAGRLRLMKAALASADTFVIGKRDTSKLREIWNGGLLTKAATAPDKPPLQASPAALATLECTADRPLYVSGRDGKVFFDQLKVPASIQPYLGRPRVPVELLRTPPP